MSQESTPLISVIIPNLNGENVLPYCLSSLLRQTYKNFEIIIIDNGSTDKSLDLIYKYSLKFSLSNIKVHVISLKRNIGYSAAITLGAMLSNGKYILVANNDVIFEENYLKNLVENIEKIRRKSPEIVAASGIHYYYPEINVINYAGGGLTLISGYYIFYGRSMDTLTEYEKRYLTSFRYLAFPTGAGALIDRNIFLQLGGYYPLYFAGIEEIDMGVMLYRAGYKVVHIPTAILYHMESFTLGGRGIFVPHKLFLILRGLLIYYFRHYEPHLLILSLIIYKFVNFGILLLSIIKNSPELVYAIIRSFLFFIKFDIRHAKKYRTFIYVKSKFSFSQVRSQLHKYNVYKPLKYSIKDYLQRLIFYTSNKA